MSKNTESPTPLISVITVVYNSESLLERTIDSIKTQDFDDFEYLVIDGGSTDGSLEIIKQNQDAISHWISEPDKGIYDAMNKAVGMAKGQYLNFMNAGDYFHDTECLKKVSTKLQNQACDILYGNVVKQSSEDTPFYYEKGQELTNKSFFLGNPMCHQAMFIRRSLFDKSKVGLYDLSFKAGAFYEWLAKYYAYRSSLDEIVYLNEKIAVYLDGGFSFKAKRQIDIDRLRSVRTHFPFHYVLKNYLRFIPEYLKGHLLPLMERLNILDLYRTLKYRKNKQAVPHSYVKP